ncbi:hypothetical protein [Nocardia sp. NPDC051832]|uniref:hypothetical protein n=1 Tax=Nocardia sp. NPDC051832 TaxID=3155673 RepID=UPI00343850A9
MSSSQLIIVVVTLISGLAITVLCVLPSRHPDVNITYLPERRSAGYPLRPPDTWPGSWQHDAPDHPLGTLEAHHVMQRHRDCTVDGCRHKAAAFYTLVAAGRIRPDSSRSH